MNDAEFFERVVQEVLRRLRQMQPSGTTAPPPGGVNSTSPTRSLAVDQPVVALATLNGRLEAVDQIVVRHNAVVTPSVRDELNDRNIRLVRNKP